MPSGWEKFKIILSAYGWLCAWAIGASAAPFAVAFAALAPPWPGIALLTAVAQLAVLILTYQLLKAGRRQVVNRVIVAAFVGLLLASTIYVTLFQLFTYQPPDSKERDVRGFFCTQIAQSEYPNRCPFLGADELKEAGNVPNRLWTMESIAATHVTLLLSWILAFMLLTTLIGSFIVHQQRQSKSAKARAAGGNGGQKAL
jgi:hypothetical protein